MSRNAKPFRFSYKQRQILLDAWKRPTDERKAKAYFDAIEPRIQMWLEGRDLSSGSATHAEIRDTCLEFREKLFRLRKFMDREQEKLYALIGNTSTTEEEQRIREAAKQLRESSAILADAALNTATSIRTVSGPDINAECRLVAMLAQLYRMVFHKEPAKSPGSNFQLFLSKLAKMIGINIGPEAISAGIRGDGINYVPPATGGEWRGDENL